ANLLISFNDHPIARMETFLYYPKTPAAVTDPHRLDMDFIVGVDNRHLETALQFRNGTLRHKQAIVLEIQFHSHAGELARAKRVPWVREECLHPKGTRREADLTIGGIDFALERIHRAICEDQINLQLPEAAIPIVFGGELFGEIDIGLFRDVVV